MINVIITKQRITLLLTQHSHCSLFIQPPIHSDTDTSATSKSTAPSTAIPEKSWEELLSETERLLACIENGESDFSDFESSSSAEIPNSVSYAPFAIIPSIPNLPDFSQHGNFSAKSTPLLIFTQIILSSLRHTRYVKNVGHTLSSRKLIISFSNRQL